MGDVDDHIPADESLAAWCAMWLGARPVRTLFSAVHLSRVTGLVLDDGRRVVVKVRPGGARLQGCAFVQRTLWAAGFPCPEPLAGPVPYGADGALVANAEAIIDGGTALSDLADGAADAYAGLLAHLVRVAPAADDAHLPGDGPPWTAWDHSGTGLWPPADDGPADLNAVTGPPWIDDLGYAVRARLAEATVGMPVVLGHGDWEAQNLRWQGLRPVAVHDWDSVMAAPEPVVVGLAAAVWPSGAGDTWHAASLPQSAAFIEAYQRAAHLAWAPVQVEAAWAAGLWVRTFNEKKWSLRPRATQEPPGSGGRGSADGVVMLTPDEARARCARAGIAFDSS